MKRFKHSGALGDLIYSLPIVKHFGGGEFYLHLDQINWIGQHYYGSRPDPFHQGRMNQQDYEFMKEFMLAQEYITDFKTLDINTEITHNLDRFRPVFVGHPTNYIDIYADVFNIDNETALDTIRTSSWLTAPGQKQLNNRNVVINRSRRWIPLTPGQQWQVWKQQGLEDRSVFVGLPNEYQAFCQETGWRIPHQQTKTMLELAEYIAGADQFIGNQSQCLALSIGLGVKDIWCEARVDMPLERNECYFPNRANITYF